MADTINTCIRSLLSSRTFHDLDLVCVDGTLSYPKLLAGLVFPSLSTCNILKFPSHHTLLLPDFTVTDVMKIVETVLGFSLDSYHVPDHEFGNNEVSEFEDSNDLSKFLHVEAFEGEVPSPGYESDEEFSPDKPLICKICYATFKTRSGWKNHKVTHQKFRTKEFACYICYRRFYWDKDCRRHIKNIHGEENYDALESRKAANVNYPKSRNVYQPQPYQPQTQHQQQQQYHPSTNTNTSKFVHPNNNIFKMKIELLKNQEKKAINTNAIKEPNSDENMSPLEDFSPPDTNENTNDCFYNYNHHDENEDDNDGHNSSSTSPCTDFVKESTITMEEIKDHIQKVKDDLGELLEEGNSSDGNVGGHDDSFETVDPNLYTDDANFTERNISGKISDDSEEDTDMTEPHLVENNDFDGTNVDGGVAISDFSSVTSSNSDFQVNENLTVDMFDFKIPADIVIEPKTSSDLFHLKKRFKCQECPRKFLNVKYLKIHEKSCSVPADSPYKCTICERSFQDFDSLQMHWKINHNRQKMI